MGAVQPIRSPKDVVDEPFEDEPGAAEIDEESRGSDRAAVEI